MNENFATILLCDLGAAWYSLKIQQRLYIIVGERFAYQIYISDLDDNKKVQK